MALRVSFVAPIVKHVFGLFGPASRPASTAARCVSRWQYANGIAAHVSYGCRCTAAGRYMVHAPACIGPHTNAPQSVSALHTAQHCAKVGQAAAAMCPPPA